MLQNAPVFLPSTRRRAAVVALTLFCSYGYFYEGGGWNQNSRFDLVRALVERHSVEIDAYVADTGDRAWIAGHSLSDKAPGASLTAAPAVAIARAALRAAHRPTTSPPAIGWLSYVATLTASAVPAAVAGVSVMLAAALAGADDLGATVLALALGLGTPLWAYATVMWGHALAAGALSLAFLGALLIAPNRSDRHNGRLGALVGLSAGWAVVSEYPAAVPAVLLAGLALARARGSGRRLAHTAGGVAAGALVAAAVLAAYNVAASGKVFFVTYEGLVGYPETRHGLFGVADPRLDVLGHLLFGSFRGLLPLAPVLALAPLGLWYWWRRRDGWRAAGLVAAAIIAAYFAVAAGYYYWSAGWSYGPRYVGAALGFMAVLLAPVWVHGRRWMRAAIVALACIGVANSLAAVSTSPQPSVDVARPLTEFIWPHFLDGDLALNWQSVDDLLPPNEPMSWLDTHRPRAAWNLGERVGLAERWSLVPLAGLWLVAAWAWRRVG